MLLEGLHIPLTTPFHADGRLNPHKLATNVARYSKTPAAGLIVLGPTGEPTLLDDEETREALATAAGAATPEKVLIAGITRDSARSTLALADRAAAYRYDALLIAPPAILSLDAHKELSTYLQTIADRAPLPIVLLSTITRPIPSALAVELARHPNVIALLDATLDAEEIGNLLAQTASMRHDVTVTQVFAAVTNRMTAATRPELTNIVAAATLSHNPASAAVSPAGRPAATLQRTRTKTVGFQVVTANTSAMLEGLRTGAVGIAPAFAACAPQACYEVYQAFKDNDQPLAEEKQFRLREAATLTESLGPGALKHLADINGYYGGPPRLPHLPPTGEQRATLAQLISPMRS